MRGGGCPAAGSDDPALEARMIVEHFTGTERRDAIVSPDRPFRRSSSRRSSSALARRLAGEPVHRIFGWRDFYGLRLKLSPDTLEPRPDTETLVDAVLPLLRQVVAAGRALPCPRSRHRHRRDCAGDCGQDSGSDRHGDRHFGGRAWPLRPRTPRPWASPTVSSRSCPTGFRPIDGKFHAIVSNPALYTHRKQSTGCSLK